MFKRRGRPALSSRRAFLVLPIWLGTAIWLWQWWFSAYDDADLALYIPLTFALFYEYIVMPSVVLFSIFSAKDPIKRKLFPGKKVAIITPCVPAKESLAVIEKQLKAMAAVTYPHDSWILDEGNNPKIKQMARRYGVKYFSRKGIAKYNQADYPFKAKTKAGNINAWLDKVKKKQYDFFVQMDIDHLPQPDYLDKTLGHFRDKKVAWVQAPSVYNNLTHWTARGSAEQELGFHGPIQMCLYGRLDAPVIVGSHTTFRMHAIQDIGGFQPTRAEDHLNTLVLMNKGWNGVFIPEVIAEGDGPETFSAYLSQQYAWAFSMTQILKTYSWQNLKKLSLMRKLSYVFLQTWYPLWSISYAILFAVPLAGLLLNTYAIDTDSGTFLTRFVPAFAASLLVCWASMPLAQPQGLKLSWRGILLHVIRWPVILMAVTSSFAGRVKPYQITPKGRFLNNVPTVKLYRPFLFLSIVASFSILFSISNYGADDADGLLIFAGTNLLTMLSVCVVDLGLRLKAVRIQRKTFVRHWLRPTFAVLGVSMISLLSFGSALAASNNTSFETKLDPTVLARTSGYTAATPPDQLNDQQLMHALSLIRQTTTPAPSIGVYSPTDRLDSTEPYINHGFYDWREDRRLAEETLLTLRSGNTALITIEPKGDKNGARLLEDIALGRYDQTLQKLTNIMGATDSQIYVRFAHEMDFADTYPWGNQDPDTYIRAYRYVVTYFTSHNADNVHWVWSPGGLPNARLYYPGDEYVDVIGTTMLYDAHWQGDRFIPFHDLSYERRWLREYNKPLWITEFGLGRSNEANQQAMLAESLSKYKSYGFDALVYINIPDSNINGPDYRLDDLSLLRKPASQAQATAKTAEALTSKQDVMVFHAPLVASPQETKTYIATIFDQ